MKSIDSYISEDFYKNIGSIKQFKDGTEYSIGDVVKYNGEIATVTIARESDYEDIICHHCLLYRDCFKREIIENPHCTGRKRKDKTDIFYKIDEK